MAESRNSSPIPKLLTKRQILFLEFEHLKLPPVLGELVENIWLLFFDEFDSSLVDLTEFCSWYQMLQNFFLEINHEIIQFLEIINYDLLNK